MKRLSGVVVVLAFGIGLWAGPAWGQDAGAVASPEAGSVPTNPVRGVLADVRTVLARLEATGPLRSLLSVVGAQLETLEAQLATLYDDLFVDTCPDCESG